MVNVACDSGNNGGSFSVNHLFVGNVNFTPRASLFQGRRRASPVANVGHGDLDGVFVHRYVESEDFSTNNGVLSEVLRGSTTYHEQAGCSCLDLDLGQFDKVFYRVDRHVFVGVFPLVFTNSESCTTIRECGAEDGYSTFIASLDQAVFLHGVSFV